MKAIVHTVKGDAPTKKRVAYLANKAVLLGDWVGNSVAFNAERLTECHHGRGRETRHIILSLERGADMENERLAQAAEKFIAAFAPGVAWLGAVDRNQGTVHLHLVVVNSNGERTLNLSPSLLRQMQDVATWSGGLLETGRRGAVLRKLSTAHQIAEMTYEQIQQSIEDGSLEIGRRSKRGVVASVVLAGRRVRLSTVQRTAAAVAGRGSAHWQYDDSETRMDGHMDTRQRRQDAARRGVGRSPGCGPLGAATPRQWGKQGPSRPAPGGESPELPFTRARPFQEPAGLAGDFRMAHNPQMGGPIR